jgi:hypothetical protein
MNELHWLRDDQQNSGVDAGTSRHNELSNNFLIYVPFAWL